MTFSFEKREKGSNGRRYNFCFLLGPMKKNPRLVNILRLPRRFQVSKKYSSFDLALIRSPQSNPYILLDEINSMVPTHKPSRLSPLMTDFWGIIRVNSLQSSMSSSIDETPDLQGISTPADLNATNDDRHWNWLIKAATVVCFSWHLFLIVVPSFIRNDKCSSENQECYASDPATENSN